MRNTLWLTAMVLAAAGLLGCHPGPAAAKRTDSQPATQPGAAGPTSRAETEDGKDGYRVRWAQFQYSTSVDLPRGTGQSSLQLSGVLETPSDADVVAVSRMLDVEEVLDEHGQSLVDKNAAMRNIRRAFRGRVVTGGREYTPAGEVGYRQYGGIPVSLSLGPIAGNPRQISRLTGYASVLVVSEKQIKEFEAEDLSSYTQVAPGVDVKLERMPSPNRSTVHPPERGETQPVQFILKIRKATEDYQGVNRAPTVTSFKLLDQNGKEIDSQQFHRNYTGGSYGRYETHMSGQFLLRPDQDVRTARLTVVLQTQEVKVPFALYDIPLP